MRIEQKTSWATEELADVNLGDKRLKARLMKMCDRFSEAPESPINQACADWAETKAAYRFFQNVEKIYSNGLIMHTCLAVTTEGLPLGLLDQKIFSRKLRPQKAIGKGKQIGEVLPVEEKESYRWLEALIDTKEALGDTEVITVCDREADFYDFFQLSDRMAAPVLVRATANRTVNKKSRYAEKDVAKLWDHVLQQPEAGSYTIDIPKRAKTKHCKARKARTATVTVRFGSVRFNPPRNHPKHDNEELSDIDMYAVYVLEPNPPDGEDPVEWMLLTNLPVNSFDEAYEKVLWYCLRWRIEMFFKVLKSGFRVEACRLG